MSSTATGLTQLPSILGQSSTTFADSAAPALYEQALELTRKGQYDTATLAYEQLLNSFPGHAKGWISYGQMQKKRLGVRGSEAAYGEAKTVLQRGATAVQAADSSRAAAEIVQILGDTKSRNVLSTFWQALGLLDLQYGRPQEAVQQLERAVELDERLRPVLNWRAVREIQKQQQQQ